MTSMIHIGTDSVTRPTDVLRKFVLSCLRSAFFLSMFVTLGFATPCALRPWTKKERHWMYMVTGAVGGSMALFEVRGRQLGNCIRQGWEHFKLTWMDWFCT